MSAIRIQRLEKELTKLISIALNSKIRDPRLQWVTITGITLSKDLHYAKIYISHYNNKASHRKILELLTKASGFIKKEIAGAKLMRTIPEISFLYDDTEDKAAHMDQLLASLKDDYDDEDVDEDYDLDDYLDDDEDFFDDDFDDYDDLEDDEDEDLN
ncbi:MAG TPA: 30S ribosome-binding factor RbfA [Candidatus Cloacimonadota bacterium]|nr:30S ribosome-binding factor RbfA [Candidatus Cloacimonadota bacterium]HPT72761.1 30S ribosome-binding factor RbfA [Candidatus Cloacimonadota bacterium]